MHDTSTIVLLVVSALCFVGFNVTVTVVVDWRAGVGLFAFLVLVGYALWLLLVWVQHSFFLPRYTTTPIH